MTGAAVVALICRLSPRPDGSYEGVDEQEDWGREYAAATWPGLPVEVFADRGVSATTGEYRPGLEAFLKRLDAGAVAHVWAVEQSRLSREMDGRYPWFHLAARMTAAGVTELHTKRGGIVRVGEEVAGIMAVLDAAETRKLKVRVRDEKDAARRAGNWRKVSGGVPPLGFDYTEGDDDWHTDPAAAAMLRDVAARVLADPEHRVATAFKAQPVVHDAAGRVATEAMVRHALKRPATAGLMTDRDGKVIGPAGDGDPPLDELTWRRLRQVFKGRTMGRRVDDDTYWAGPLLRCSGCGNRMSGMKVYYDGRQVPYLGCRNPHKGTEKPCRGVSIKADDVNAMIRTAVEAWAATSPAFAAASRVRAGQASERDRLAADLATERRLWGRVAARYAELDDDQWAEAEAQHDATVARIEGQLASLAETLAAPPMPAEVQWDTLSGEERRTLAKRALVLPVKVAPGRGGLGGPAATERIKLKVRR